MWSRPRPSTSQALVEFALVVPLMLALSLGALQLVLYAHARDVIISSVQEAARLAAEDGRGLDEGNARARQLIAAGLGASADPFEVHVSIDSELVTVWADAALRPIVPAPATMALSIHAAAQVARERFRPGG